MVGIKRNCFFIVAVLVLCLGIGAVVIAEQEINALDEMTISYQQIMGGIN